MVEFQNYIEKGGVIFSLLLIMSAIGLTIILYKFFELYLLKNNDFKTFDNCLRESKTISQFEQSSFDKLPLKAKPQHAQKICKSLGQSDADNLQFPKFLATV